MAIFFLVLGLVALNQTHFPPEPGDKWVPMINGVLQPLIKAQPMFHLHPCVVFSSTLTAFQRFFLTNLLKPFFCLFVFLFPFLVFRRGNEPSYISTPRRLGGSRRVVEEASEEEVDMQGDYNGTRSTDWGVSTRQREQDGPAADGNSWSLRVFSASSLSPLNI